MAVQNVTEENFEALLTESTLPVFIDFYADWCGPCKALAPVVEKLSTTYEGQMIFAKIDVEKNPSIAQMFGVRSIPTLVFLKDRRVVDGAVGALSAAELEQKIQQIVGPPKPRSGPQAFEAKKLKLSIEAGTAVAVDVREANDYNRVRIPGAVHVPPGEVDTHIETLQQLGARCVFYARTTEGAREAAEKAAAAGLSAGWLDGGLLAWETELFPIERPA